MTGAGARGEARTPAGSAPSRYALYGETLASRFPFRTRLQPATGQTTWEFELAAGGARPETAGLPRLFASPHLTAAGEPAAELYGGGGVELLRFAGCCDFVLDGDRIAGHLHDPAGAPQLEVRLLGAVVGYLLERAGLLVLHGSAVVAGGRAVAFAGGNRAGKTGLAAAWMERGARLLTDDLLAIDSSAGVDRALPGPPEMRVWPDAAARFLPDRWQRLTRVLPAEDKRRLPVGGDGFGLCHGRPAELAALVLPRRRAAAGRRLPALDRLAPAAALRALLTHSYSPLLVEAVGWRERRLTALASLAERLPVFELRYDGGLERLGEVAEAVARGVSTG